MLPATKPNIKIIFLLVIVSSLVLTSCLLLPEGSGGGSTPIPSVTPPGDMLVLQADQYTHTLEEGGRVPGTGIVYRSIEADNIFVDIDGQPSVRRVGDILTGSSIVVPGVHVQYNLRLMTAAFSNPRVIGPVTATVFNPLPQELLGYLEPPAANFVYDAISVDYRIPVGRVLPGSTVVYRGVDPNGNGASLSGTAQYAILPEQNTFVWTGLLRPNVIIQYDLRAVSVTTEELRMVGTAKLFLYQQPPPVQ